MDRTQSAHDGSCRSAFQRSGAWTVLALVAAIAVLSIGSVGCAPRSGPQVAAPAPPPKPEPYVLLRLGERRVYLVENETRTPPQGYPVAIGQRRWPTPTGRFRINEMVVNPDFLRFDFSKPTGKTFGRIPPGPANPLGLRWIGFAQAHGWAIGFHGTQKTSVLGSAVSHGCVRMSNGDVVKLYDRVKLGTTVVVED